MSHAIQQDADGVYVCRCGRIFASLREATRHVNAWEQQLLGGGANV